MESFQIYKNLAWLNDLPNTEAESVFRDCCGSAEWGRQMTAARPFQMLDELFMTAEEVWFALSPAEWLEAFAAHPKIGSKTAAPVQKKLAAEWSAGEQSGIDAADEKVRDEIAEANRLYENKFGFIFIVCATGKSADEMLAICKARVGNSLETEIRIAAHEQQKITEIRLGKLLEK